MMNPESDQYSPPYSHCPKDAVGEPIAVETVPLPTLRRKVTQRGTPQTEPRPSGSGFWEVRNRRVAQRNKDLVGQGCVTGVGQNSNLDILRSVAVLAVFVTHAVQVIAGCRYGEHLAYGVETYSLGRIGVLIFFVHTSLVLMQSLERAATNLLGWSLIRYFYIRRAFRIYPLSFCLIFVSIVFSIPPNALGVPYIWHGARWASSNILLIQNITGVSPVSGPLWSLPYEAQMYLILPLLLLALRTPRGSNGLSLIYVIGTLLSLFYPLFQYLPCFLAGVISYQLLGTVRPRVRAWLWSPAVVGIVVLYVFIPNANVGALKDVLICLIVGALIPLFQQNSGAITTVASHIAKYSYGIYLCHTPLLWLLYRKLTIPDWQRPIWLVIATGIVSWACYHAIEHPLIQIGTRLANRVSMKVGK
jgi:peptidoglycan/LPS O-acetylase OafA/YrhL